jgi:hypothetical protein
MKYSEFRDASGRLTVGLDNFPSIIFWWIKRGIAKKFSLKKAGERVETVNEKFQSYSGENGSVSVGWDNWSGLTVTALNSDSESLVLNIGEYLKNKYRL